MDDDDEEFWESDTPPSLTVYVTEPEVLGVLYGPDGEELVILYDRATVPFGFQSARR